MEQKTKTYEVLRDEYSGEELVSRIAEALDLDTVLFHVRPADMAELLREVARTLLVNSGEEEGEVDGTV